jgi:hypothetical protein
VFTVCLDSTPPYITVTAAGVAGLAELSGLSAFVAEVAKNRACAQVLADLSKVEPRLSFTDHLRLGGLVWELLGGLERLAAVVPPGYLDAPAVRAARLAGVPLRAFLELADARAWMAHGGSSASGEQARSPRPAEPSADQAPQ